MPDITPGLVYRAKSNGFEGEAQKPDKPQEGKTYRLDDGIECVSVGPVPGDESKWVVMIGDTPDIVDRGLLPVPYPRVGVQGIGPKGAPERRYFNAADLEEVADHG